MNAIEVNELNVYYGKHQALKDIHLEIPEKSITALIGPSGCGKSTLLRTINRMNDQIQDVRVEGDIQISGYSIYEKGIRTEMLRKRVGMVFQLPNPFPMSIYDNIAYGPRLHGIKKKAALNEIVETSLRAAAVWEEVKDNLKHPALSLSGGQQQRICIARALAVNPDILLMDESTAALDPVSTQKIEELVKDLKQTYTIVMVTHNLAQAARISDQTAFLLSGECIEYASTLDLFSSPVNESTSNYVMGRFG
ncbi:phosphate ABC transporter ATP-binding protein [Paenibacillus sp. IHB B 3415]|uniref:phosphate ABC transporter ATP-binding protein PstB n=1 Tax=Paenibacillus sp. IHB B 3415 TaxID=867080 RepID=UPI000574631C|nr:phosphate ABC transporter ATP-binding protein PstB [Paenibacillus sp. IHB B 3415]KHL96779.1 phosphate ABC transporter ATP-binding protein [Paenibacillus sp. IHB B 3415]